ncbi:MAG: acyltransferase [Muribaculaceae bacterium]|nr:acyltransferase [Muribaculaceae bacterium]
MKRKIFLILYYGIARWLPAFYRPGGRLGKAMRVWCCRHIFAECGSEVNIERGAYFGHGRNVRLGSRSGLGVNAHIKDNTIIGNDVMMGPNFVVQESRHSFERTDIPMGQQPELPPQQVIIGNDIWIGADVMIIGNRHVADGSILAARAVITKDFPPYSIIGGNPSRLIRSRI